MIDQKVHTQKRVPESDFSGSAKSSSNNSSASPPLDTAWLKDIYMRRELKQNFQKSIFWITLVVSGVMICIFNFVLFYPKHIMPLLEKTPFIIAPISLLAIMPGYWISLLIKGVFSTEKKEEEKEDSVLSSAPPYVMVKDIAKGINNT